LRRRHATGPGPVGRGRLRGDVEDILRSL